MSLLCEPYLLDPQPDAVHVLWHTAQPGTGHSVLVGPGVAALSERQAATGTGDGPGWRRFPADTTALSRTREDASSRVPGQSFAATSRRPVYRHLAHVTGLAPGRTAYRVVSVDGDTTIGVSPPYSLAPAVPPGRAVRLLLTSDHQLKPMVPANLAMVAATVDGPLDGVLMAGDMVNVPDRASDWFDSTDGPAFFASMTGRARQELAGHTWRGAPLLQHCPLFPAIGNHEVMGPRSPTACLFDQFDASRPDDWNVETYQELFPLPASPGGGCRWWSRTIGDVHVTALFVTRRWHDDDATFQEAPENLAEPQRWGRGQFLYEPIGRGSAQYEWLRRELSSPACRGARFRVVLFHHPSHGLGRHSAPPYTQPVPTVRRDPVSGAITAVRYDYPLAGDVILGDLEPLLSAAGVHLVLTGHSHLWNRFRNPAGVNWLESSNVGNSHGAYDRACGLRRPLPPGDDYVGQGDPGGLLPVVPTVAPLTGPDGAALPYLSSNTVTAFSILDSGAGVVRSYRFDTTRPTSDAVLFDEFPLA